MRTGARRALRWAPNPALVSRGAGEGSLGTVEGSQVPPVEWALGDPKTGPGVRTERKFRSQWSHWEVRESIGEN